MTDTATTDQLKLSIDLVAASAYAAYFNALSGSFGSPACKVYLDRMSHPVPGDLVLEITKLSANSMDRIGRLVSCDQEAPPYIKQDEYDEEEWGKPYPPYLETVYRIETLDGRKYAWWNASFIVIPEHPFKHQGKVRTDVG